MRTTTNRRSPMGRGLKERHITRFDGTPSDGAVHVVGLDIVAEAVQLPFSRFVSQLGDVCFDLHECLRTGAPRTSSQARSAVVIWTHLSRRPISHSKEKSTIRCPVGIISHGRKSTADALRHVDLL